MRLFIAFAACCAVAFGQTEISSCGFVAQTNGAPGTPHVYTVAHDLVQTPGQTCISIRGRKDVILDGAGHKLTYSGIGVNVEATTRARVTGFFFDTAGFNETDIGYSAIWKSSGTQTDLEIDNNIFRSDVPGRPSKRHVAITNNNVHAGFFRVRNNYFRLISQDNKAQDVVAAFSGTPGARSEFIDNVVYYDGNVTSQGERARFALANPRPDEVVVVKGNIFQFGSPATVGILEGNTEAVSSFCGAPRVPVVDPANGSTDFFWGIDDPVERPAFYFDNDIVTYSPSRVMVNAGCEGATFYRNRIFFRGTSCIGLIRDRDTMKGGQMYENYFDMSEGSTSGGCSAFDLGANFSLRGIREDRVFDNVVVGMDNRALGIGLGGHAEDHWIFNNDFLGMDSAGTGAIQFVGGGTRPNVMQSVTVTNEGSGYTEAKAFVEGFGDSGGAEVTLTLAGGSVSAADVFFPGGNYAWNCSADKWDDSCGLITTPRLVVVGDGTGATLSATMATTTIDELPGMRRVGYDFNRSTGANNGILRFALDSGGFPEFDAAYSDGTFCASTHNGAALDGTNISSDTAASAGFGGTLAEFRSAGQCACETTMPAVRKRFFNEVTGQPDVGPNITCGPTVGARVDLGSPVAPDAPALIDAAIAAFGDGGSVGRRRMRGAARMGGGVRVE